MKISLKFLALAAFLTAMSSLRADIVATHTGNANPGMNYAVTGATTENFRPYDVVAGVTFDYTQRPGIGPISDGGTPSWQVQDLQSDASTTSMYEFRLASTAGLLANSYWRFSTYVHAYPKSNAAGDTNSEFNCAFGIYTHTYNQGSIAFGYGYGGSMYDNGAGGTTFHMTGNNGTAVNLTLGTGYQWIELIHNPTSGQTGLYINGQLTVADAAYNNAAGGSYGGNIVDWGDMIQTNGGYGGGAWNRVEFEYSPTALAPIGVPEPGVAACVAAGGVLLLGVLRRRRVG